MRRRRIKPTEDRVLVRPEGAYYAEERPSGLVVATDDTMVDREAPEVGEVLEVGPGRVAPASRSARARFGLPEGSSFRVPMDVVEGDRVLFGRYAGDDVDDGVHDRLVVLRQDEILARVGCGHPGEHVVEGAGLGGPICTRCNEEL